MRTVHRERHTKYAKENRMSRYITDDLFSIKYRHKFILYNSHFVSARTNDTISACFLKVAAEVMNVKLTAADIQRVTVSTETAVDTMLCV